MAMSLPVPASSLMSRVEHLENKVHHLGELHDQHVAQVREDLQFLTDVLGVTLPSNGPQPARGTDVPTTGGYQRS